METNPPITVHVVPKDGEWYALTKMRVPFIRFSWVRNAPSWLFHLLVSRETFVCRNGAWVKDDAKNMV